MTRLGLIFFHVVAMFYVHLFVSTRLVTSFKHRWKTFYVWFILPATVAAGNGDDASSLSLYQYLLLV